MPELPEVETTKNGIAPFILNQEFEKIIVRQEQLRWKIPRQLNNILKSNKVISIERRAKYILIRINNHGSLLIHLGMSGSLQILSPDQITPAQKHDHVDFIFTNHYLMRYTDPRRFGAILWLDLENPLEHKLLKHLGPEPLSKIFSSNYLFKKINHKNTSIKQAIMDSKIVVGVGNIYANEALFLSHIRPDRLAKSLSIEEINLLTKNIKIILKQAIKQGGTTLKDFKNSDGKPGYFKQELLVYGRKNQACLRCSEQDKSQNKNKFLLKEIRQNNRSSILCENCQH